MSLKHLFLLTALCPAVALLGCSDKDRPPASDPILNATPTPTPGADTPASLPWIVATANPHATRAGAAILAKGGSAVDAAVAVQATLTLVEPQSSGLGGGAFMLLHDASSGELLTYDGRETAPASARPDMFLKDDGTPMGFYDAVTSGKSVGVPGVVAMLGKAHDAHGTLPWEELFYDAAELAYDGFEISPRLAGMIARLSRLSDQDAARALYFDEAGEPLTAGAILKNPAYAETLRILAHNGPSAFYEGPIAQGIVDTVNAKAGDGTLTLADFAGYTPLERDPVCTIFVGHEVCSMAPPSSGGVTLLQILGLTERATAIAEGPTAENWAAYVEASRLAYADRDRYLADPVSMGDGERSADDLIDGLLSPRYLDERSRLIGDEAAPEVSPGEPTAGLGQDLADDASPNRPSTSHFSIRDGEGNIVSMTTSVEMPFGSHLVAGGMILNNQLTDFSFVPEKDGMPVANAVAPGKRPRSSMTPVIAYGPGDVPAMAIGSPGGPAIIGYVAKTVMGSLAWDMDLQAAIDMHHVVVPRGSVLVEEGIPDEVKEALTDYGFEFRERALTSGLYGFRLHEDGSIEPGVDARREGTVEMSEGAKLAP